MTRPPRHLAPGRRTRARALDGGNGRRFDADRARAGGLAVGGDAGETRGAYAIRRLPRGARLRVDEPRRHACAGLVVYNAEQTSERLNAADTVKVQWNAYLGAGSLLLSDMGRSLMAVLEDSCGHHDLFCGTRRGGNARRYGSGGAHGVTRPAATASRRARQARARPPRPAREPQLLRRRAGGSRTASSSSCGASARARRARAAARRSRRAGGDRERAARRSTSGPAPKARGVRLPPGRASRPAPDDPIRLSTPERRRAYENVDEYLLGRERGGERRWARSCTTRWSRRARRGRTSCAGGRRSASSISAATRRWTSSCTPPPTPRSATARARPSWRSGTSSSASGPC